jgi:L-rhamnose mutarotase
MQRVCFLLQVKADRLAEYKRLHKAVWPEMLAALRRCRPVPLASPMPVSTPPPC